MEKKNEIVVEQFDKRFLVTINNQVLPNVIGYKLKSNSNGELELLLRIKVNAEIMGLTSSSS